MENFRALVSAYNFFPPKIKQGMAPAEKPAVVRTQAVNGTIPRLAKTETVALAAAKRANVVKKIPVVINPTAIQLIFSSVALIVARRFVGLGNV